MVALMGTGTLAATLKYNGVDVTIKASLADGRLGTSASASPVLGAKNPPIRGGVAFVGMSHEMGDYAATLGTKLPTSLHLDARMGSLKGNLQAVPLRQFDLKTDQTDVALTLPAAKYSGKMDVRMSRVELTLPVNVGVRFNLKKFHMSSLTIDGERVADSQEGTGFYATKNYETAPYNS